MKKLLGIVVLGLLLSSNVYANAILLECEEKEGYDSLYGDKAQSQDTLHFRYYLLSSDMKTLQGVGMIRKAKGECALGNCEEKIKWDDYKLPFQKQDSKHIFFGRKWFDERELFDHHTINKTNLELVHYDNMISYEPGVIGNEKQIIVESQTIYQCKKINKFPF